MAVRRKKASAKSKAKIVAAKPKIAMRKAALVAPKKKSRAVEKKAKPKKIVSKRKKPAPIVAPYMQQPKAMAKATAAALAPTQLQPEVGTRSAQAHENELPSAYGKTKIVLLVRDPWWLYSYWEVTQGKKKDLERVMAVSWGEIKKYLRVYDVTDVDFNGKNANSFFDIEISDQADNWYINVGKPDRSWCVDLGAKDRDGNFYLIARSNCVKTPRNSASCILDEEWMIDEDAFRKMYAISGGFGIGASSPAGMRMGFPSGGLTSPTKKRNK